MPKGGARANAGRKKGSKNRITIEREVRLTQVRARHMDQEGPKLGKDVVDDFMNIATMYAKKYTPSEEDLEQGKDKGVEELREWKRKQFRIWASLAVKWAADLMPYQSPTFRAISIAPQSDMGREEDNVVVHTIEDVRQQLILRGVPPDQFAKALAGPLIEHDPAEKK